MNLINETHHSCERKKYIFIVLQKYIIISRYSHEISFSPKILKSAQKIRVRINSELKAIFNNIQPS